MTRFEITKNEIRTRELMSAAVDEIETKKEDFYRFQCRMMIAQVFIHEYAFSLQADRIIELAIVLFKFSPSEHFETHMRSELTSMVRGKYLRSRRTTEGNLYEVNY
jgi:hypothetical protein